MVQVVILSANGESRTMKTTAIAAGAAVTGAMAAKVFRKTKAAETLGTYKYKGATLTLWGYAEGKAGTENKHELPPPHDEALFFGDIVVVSSKGDLTVDEWSQFYDEAFGGFEDLDSEEEEESEAEEEDEDGDADELDDDAEEEEDESESEAEDGEAEEEDVSESEAEEEEEEDAADDDCYDDEDAGGSKRRAPRRRTVTAPEYRRLDMGLKSRVKVPSPPGKRAPRWQTAAELEPEAYE
jgi:hypothetical protein